MCLLDAHSISRHQYSDSEVDEPKEQRGEMVSEAEKDQTKTHMTPVILGLVQRNSGQGVQSISSHMSVQSISSHMSPWILPHIDKVDENLSRPEVEEYNHPQ
jgi:hypothetical protein